ncbi:uncharacterized protein LOC105665272 [Ceratitis capitata]|uniref:Uncharacterized protein n=1 Tax=Ceratitis capitata TaxID=7213 RepID=W8BU75_CERCA|nr:uncharacterized protein LOC105665272 [Ceratitis capitata]
MPKRSRQIMLPTSRIYMERERLRQLEISAPMPNSTIPALRVCQMTGERDTNNDKRAVMPMPMPSENKKVLNATKVQNAAQTEDILASNTFRDRVLPELTVKLQQHMSNSGNDCALVKHSTTGSNVEMLFSNINEIPPAAETWQRSDCFNDNGELRCTNVSVEKI